MSFVQSFSRLCLSVLAVMLFVGCNCSRTVVPDPKLMTEGGNPAIKGVHVDMLGDPYPRFTTADVANPDHPAFGFYAAFERLRSREGITLWNSWKGYDPAVTTKELTDDLVAWAKGFDRVTILIHGFNVEHARAAGVYDELTAIVTKEEPGIRQGFIYFYWDGLTGKGPGIWGSAQWNSAFAGENGLRHVLLALGRDRPIRIITHSRGAGVAMAALGDASRSSTAASLRAKNWAITQGILDYRSQRSRSTLVSPPLGDPGYITAILMAPAIGSYDFIDGRKIFSADYYRDHQAEKPDRRNANAPHSLELWAGNAQDYGGLRLIIGSNDSDLILDKVIRGKSGIAGSTALGATPCFAVTVHRDLVTASKDRLRGGVVDFSEKEKPTNHDMGTYVRSESLKRCLRWSITPDPDAATWSDLWMTCP